MKFKNKDIYSVFYLEKTQQLLSVLKIIFTPVALLFLAIFAYKSQEILFQLITSVNIFDLCLSICMWVSLHFIVPLLAVVIFNSESPVISYRESLLSYANRLPARYIPGGIWHTVARAFDYHQIGISRKNTMVYVILENSLSMSVALLLGSGLIMLGDGVEVPGLIMIMSLVGGISIIFLTPLFINRYIHDGNEINNILGVSTIVKSLLILLIFWFLAGLSFFVYFSALTNILQTYSYMDISGTYIFSWAIGFMALFAPQGIGITEVVAANIFNSPVGIGAIALVIFGFRGVIFCADTLMWLFIITIRK